MIPSLFLRCFLLALAGVSVSWAEPRPADLDTLLPDVSYTRKADRTYVFSRAQFKFGLGADDHLNRYVDRPLFLDPEKFDAFSRYREAAEMARSYGLDGLAFFPESGGCRVVYGFSQKAQIEGSKLLTEFYPSGKGIESVNPALETPASWKVNDKLVVTTYNTEKKPITYWRDLLARMREQYGDRFLFIPELSNFGGIPLGEWMKRFSEGTISEADLEKAREYLRGWLRVVDGIYFASTTIVRDDARNFDTAFYRDFVIRLMKSVLAEPEFRDKMLGLSAKIGHENHTRIGRTLNSDGTKTLRHSMEAAMAAKPDLINIPEWDELNESTCVMPTIFDGTSTRRILRYYTATMKGARPEPIPGDRVDLPNLIISYRKLLAMGEKLEIELLNVPDGTGTEIYSAQLMLENEDGRTVYTSPELSFTPGEMTDHTLAIPSESLSHDRILRPRLQITQGGRASKTESGLHYIEIRPTWNWDYKWVRQPLRDLLRPQEVDFRLSETVQDGARRAKAVFRVDEPLAFLEVLENDNVVYSHAREHDGWRESEDRLILSVAWKSTQGFPDPAILKGSITVHDAEAQWMRPGGAKEDEVDAGAIQGQTLLLDGQRSNLWPRRVLLSIPRSQAHAAQLAIALPGIFEGTIPVRQILEDSAYGVAGPRGLNLVISRFAKEHRIPSHLGDGRVEFSIPVVPEMETSVFHLQAIGESGRLYRSEPVALGATAERKKVTVFSDTRKEPVTAEAEAASVPLITYEFSPRHGSLLATKAGRPFWGVLGGFVTLVTERGGAPLDGAPFVALEYPADAEKTAPDWVKIGESEYALKFDGKGTYVTLPQGVIPRRAAYRIKLEVKPDESKGRQLLIANFSSRFGTLAIFLNNGILTADFLHDLKNRESLKEADLDSGLKVEPGQWSAITIGFDQRQLSFSVNGKTKSLPLAGPGMHDTVSVIGGAGQTWFKGQIKSFSIQHGEGSAL